MFILILGIIYKGVYKPKIIMFVQIIRFVYVSHIFVTSVGHDFIWGFSGERSIHGSKLALIDIFACWKLGLFTEVPMFIFNSIDIHTSYGWILNIAKSGRTQIFRG